MANAHNAQQSTRGLIIIYKYFILRLQKEKEDAYADIDRGREKYEKLQVSWLADWPGILSCIATLYNAHTTELPQFLFSPHTALN